GLTERLARVLVGEALARGAQAFDALHHPGQRCARLFDRVVALVLPPMCSSRLSISSRTRSSRSPSAATRLASSNASRALSCERRFFSRLSPRRSSVRPRSAAPESVTVATIAGLTLLHVGPDRLPRRLHAGAAE